MTDPLARHFVRGVFLVAVPSLVLRLLLPVLDGLAPPLQMTAGIIAVLFFAPLGIIGVLHLAISGLLAFGILKAPPRFLHGGDAPDVHATR